MDKNAAIGVFDSGVGGLTVAREIMRQLPEEKIIYFGDTARLPYGSKSKETVIRFSEQIIRFLRTKDVKAIVIACNTASSFALDEVRKAEDIPIMVEAIPMANDSIMLIITKVDDPDELDTRFSRFTQDHEESNSMPNLANELLEGADEILNLLGSPDVWEELKHLPMINDLTVDQEKSEASSTESGTKPAPQNMRIYQFDTLDLVCAAARHTGSIFTGESKLYKNPLNEKFYLVLKKADCDELAFSKTCNVLSEYAARQKYDPVTEAYYSEHYELFVKKNALQALANL